MASVQSLEAQHRIMGTKIPKLLSEMLQRYPKMKEGHYIYHGTNNDQLFEATYCHHSGNNCLGCDPNKIIKRVPREDSTPRIHYGIFGSANRVVKDGVTSEKLKRDLGLLCVEMEAAGLMNDFSCLIIRGICDYADLHKNRRWQPYAAATASAYAKELLSIIPAQEIVATTKAADVLQMSRGMFDLKN